MLTKTWTGPGSEPELLEVVLYGWEETFWKKGKKKLILGKKAFFKKVRTKFELPAFDIDIGPKILASNKAALCGSPFKIGAKSSILI